MHKRVVSIFITFVVLTIAQVAIAGITVPARVNCDNPYDFAYAEIFDGGCWFVELKCEKNAQARASFSPRNDEDGSFSFAASVPDPFETCNSNGNNDGNPQYIAKCEFGDGSKAQLLIKWAELSRCERHLQSHGGG